VGNFDDLSTLIVLVVGNTFWGKWIIIFGLYLAAIMSNVLRAEHETVLGCFVWVMIFLFMPQR
jgi:hypothetical protein